MDSVMPGQIQPNPVTLIGSTAYRTMLTLSHAVPLKASNVLGDAHGYGYRTKLTPHYQAPRMASAAASDANPDTGNSNAEDSKAINFNAANSEPTRFPIGFNHQYRGRSKVNGALGFRQIFSPWILPC
jgi:hypothetical protein